jgi:hypothetical protein
VSVNRNRRVAGAAELANGFRAAIGRTILSHRVHAAGCRLSRLRLYQFRRGCLYQVVGAAEFIGDFG